MLPIPEDLNNKYEFHNYGHALEILSDAFPQNGKKYRIV